MGILSMARRKQQAEIITGIDIGSTAIRIAVGQYTPRNDALGGDIHILGTADVRSSGVAKGTITSIEEAVSSVSHVLEEVERLIGVPIEHAWVGISGTQILSQESHGVIAVAKTDGEISHEDVTRVVEAAQTVAAPLNYEVVHVLPRSFSVDGQTGIKDPVGMTGVRLEVDAQMIYGATPHLKNITKAIYRTGIDIDDLVLSVMAAANTVLTQEQKELGVCMVDIGGSTTTIAVFEEGNILHTAVIPIGSNHITNDLALGLQTSIEIAERIKITHGSCNGKGLTKKDVIDLSEFGMPDQVVSKKFVTEIVSARVVELLEKIDDELLTLQRRSMLPAGVVLCGGGAKLHDIVDVAKAVFQMNASYGFPTGIRSATDTINDLSFTAAIGLVRWGAEMSATVESGMKFSIPGGTQAAKQVRKLFRFLIP